MPALSLPWKVYLKSGRGRRLTDRFATQEAAEEFAAFMDRQNSRHQELDAVRYVVVFEPSTETSLPAPLLPPGND
jgi:hypothetical protein